MIQYVETSIISEFEFVFYCGVRLVLTGNCAADVEVMIFNQNSGNKILRAEAGVDCFSLSGAISCIVRT